MKVIQESLKGALENAPEIADRNMREIQEFKRRVFVPRANV